MNFTEAVNKVLSLEGGFVNNVKDSGGATNFGITKRVYEAYLKRSVSIDEMKKMPRSHAVAIYKANYWDKISGDSIRSYKIAYAMFDQAVNRGVSTSIKQAQKMIGLPEDGIIGPATLNAINRAEEKSFLAKFLAESISDYKALAVARPKDQEFLKGWLNRVQHISSYVGVKPSAALSGVAVVLIFAFIFISVSQTKTA